MTMFSITGSEEYSPLLPVVSDYFVFCKYGCQFPYHKKVCRAGKNKKKKPGRDKRLKLRFQERMQPRISRRRQECRDKHEIKERQKGREQFRREKLKKKGQKDKKEDNGKRVE